MGNYHLIDTGPLIIKTVETENTKGWQEQMNNKEFLIRLHQNGSDLQSQREKLRKIIEWSRSKNATMMLVQV